MKMKKCQKKKELSLKKREEFKRLLEEDWKE